MGTKPIIRIEEHGKERVVSFFVNCVKPEETAGNLLRDWALENIKDYEARRYIGCAPKGRHPEGENHRPDEEIDSHEYWFQMFLYCDEGVNDTFLDAKVCDAPQGLYLVSDVALCEFNNNGGIIIHTTFLHITQNRKVISYASI